MAAICLAWHLKMEKKVGVKSNPRLWVASVVQNSGFWEVVPLPFVRL